MDGDYSRAHDPWVGGIDEIWFGKGIIRELMIPWWGASMLHAPCGRGIVFKAKKSFEASFMIFWP
jgi:hypothetical protein